MQTLTTREDASVKGFRQTRRLVLLFAWILVAVGVGIGLYGVYMTLGPAYSLDEIGEFVGGTAGSLWALAGLFFIYAAFVGQQEELVYQRVELRSTREELQFQRDDLAEQQRLQNEQARKQIFESTFFQLLRLHSDIVHRIRYEEVDIEFVDGARPQSDRLSGREAFRSFYGRYDQSYRNWTNVITTRPEYEHASSDPRDIEREDLDQAIIQSYDEFYVDVQSDLGHYFRNLYHMVKFVDSSSASLEERESYMSFIKAQLSSYELLLLFYKGLSNYGRGNFMPLIVKYALLENMPTERLIDGRHSELYSKAAFGGDA